MITRRRFKQKMTLEERLAEDTKQLRDQVKNMRPGVALDQVLERIRQNETAAHVSEGLRPSGPQQPD
jgi:hypothetical protein